MYITKDGSLYVGDMQPGDREATGAELLAHATSASAREVETKKAAVSFVRKQIIDVLTGVTVAAQLEGDTATTDAYLVVLQGLKDITEDWPADPALVDALVVQRYAALVAQCTPQMVSAFAQVAS